MLRLLRLSIFRYMGPATLLRLLRFTPRAVTDDGGFFRFRFVRNPSPEIPEMFCRISDSQRRSLANLIRVQGKR
jgi:hypothetical protein